MTKEDAIALGVTAQRAREVFHNLGYLNMQTDPEKRLAQIDQYERARADMHEATNKHHAALASLGLSEQ